MSLRSYIGQIFAEPVQQVGGPISGAAKFITQEEYARLLHGPTGKPRLATVTKAPSREAFDAWREHPVTQFVFVGLKQGAKDCREMWDSASWDSGKADQVLLNELRVRADDYNSLEGTSYEGWCELAGVEPDGGAVDSV